MAAEILPIWRKARPKLGPSMEDRDLHVFKKGFYALKGLNSPVVSENKALVHKWVSDGVLSSAERDALYEAMGWEMEL